jgi:hypothetical protein
MFRPGTTLRPVLALAAAGIVAGGGTASAAPAPKGLWATVDICNSIAHPNQMGVLASMPGNGTRQRMFMRFRAQFYDSSRKVWLPVKQKQVVGQPPVPASSGWRPAGRATQKRAELGWTFSLQPPAAGSAFVLRGVVDFQWRVTRRTKSGHRLTVVVRTLHANTKGEHPSKVADPPGYTSGTCEIR